MIDFRFLSSTEIIFGKNTQTAVGAETKKYGTKVLLHYGGGHIKRSGLYQQVVDSLIDAGVDFIEMGGVQPNPRLELVYEGIALCREKGVDFLLAVGGGSAIDSAKAIALGMKYDGDVWDFYSGKARPEKALPVGVVLTIPAAGSEASDSSVIMNGGLKRGLTTDLQRARFAIMNPELTYSLPPYQTACGISDIMAHIMERYFTRVPNVELTDRLCEAALKTVIGNAPTVMAQPDHYDARAEIMWAGTLAHNNLLSTGRIGDFASHQIEHELSAINDVAHGAGLAIIFPAWMKYVYKTDMARFTQFAVRVWNVEQNFSDPEKTVLEAIARHRSFYQSLGLPVTLAEIGITEERFAGIAKNTKKYDGVTTGRFAKLTEDDIVNILKIAQ